MTRPTFDDLGLATARLWATRSADSKVQVGACILDRHHRVVGVGYNGRAAGEPNERESLVQGGSGFIHAEVNALLAANWNGEGHTLYVTHEPCAACARLIVNSRRIGRVLYEANYRETVRVDAGLPSGAAILRRAGIEVQCVTGGADDT
ncbi:deoxycytidylate deaminase [Deinococcus sp. HMF7604]|uniref:deaminase n=1 Tax=Deinococcus betulae TaxID=2873312 RepID=UPI001CCF2348|nr:deaminase [Deinococcus betulae]MBZ9752612.1 deoxycytidylate deaminase [Deinococcus betulae]